MVAATEVPSVTPAAAEALFKRLRVFCDRRDDWTPVPPSNVYELECPAGRVVVQLIGKSGHDIGLQLFPTYKDFQPLLAPRPPNCSPMKRSRCFMLLNFRNASAPADVAFVQRRKLRLPRPHGGEDFPCFFTFRKEGLTLQDLQLLEACCVAMPDMAQGMKREGYKYLPRSAKFLFSSPLSGDNTWVTVKFPCAGELQPRQWKLGIMPSCCPEPAVPKRGLTDWTIGAAVEWYEKEVARMEGRCPIATAQLRYGLANALWKVEEPEATERALSIARQVLKDTEDMHDPLHVRNFLLEVCMESTCYNPSAWGDALAVLKSYPPEEQGSTNWLWGVALLRFKRDGDCPRSRQALQAAVCGNPLVRDMLTGRRAVTRPRADVPSLALFEAFPSTMQHDAALYMLNFRQYWLCCEGSVDWVRLRGDETHSGPDAPPRVRPPSVLACTQCGKGPRDVKLKVCQRCRTAGYCSRECQKAHWSKHKLVCVAPP